MTTITRGQKILDNITKAGAITPSGRNWLIAAVDPFHDEQMRLIGYPDVESGASVVRCIKQSMSITSTLGTVWDCHIVQWPWLTYNSGPTDVGSFQVSTNRSGQCFEFADGVVAISTGGLQVYETAAGADLSILTSTVLGKLKVADEFTQGAGRLIGIGFEVHNTTAEIYRSGAISPYRMMANDPTPVTMMAASATKRLSFSAVPVRYPPKNVAEAMIIPGTKQWEAAEGCYVVGAFHTIENPARPQGTTTPIIEATLNDDYDGTLNVSQINFVKPTAMLGPVGAPITPFRVHPIHQSGAILTGLSPQTTLTINWNVYYESFPGPAESALLPLAMPSAPYDPAVLTLYSKLTSELPMGVMVKENGLGDWFLNAAGEAARFISPLLKGTGNPLAMGVGALADYAGNSIKEYQNANPPRSQGPRQGAPNGWESGSGLKKVKAKKPQPKISDKKGSGKPKKVVK